MIQFDYYKYPKNERLHYEVSLDLSGLPIKNSNVSYMVDGEIFEEDIKEFKDDNVNLVFTGIYYLNGNQFIIDKNHYPLEIFGSIYYSGELVSEDLLQHISYDPYTSKPIMLIRGTDNKIYDISILPKHEYLRSNISGIEPSKSVLIDRELYSIVGLWDRRNATRSSDVKTRGFIGIKPLTKRINDVLDIISINSMDILINPYKKKVDDNGFDLNYSGLNRKSRFSDAKSKYAEFITNRVELQPISDISIFDPSIKDVVKSIYNKDELASDFISLFDEINAFQNTPDVDDEYNNYKRLTRSYEIIKEELGSDFDKNAELNQLFISMHNLYNTIVAYEKYTNESVFETKEFFTYTTYVRKTGYKINNTTTDKPQSNSEFIYDKYLARFLIAVDYGKRRVSRRRRTLRAFFRRRRLEDMGIRWVELKFIDTNPLSLFRKDDTPSGQIVDINIPILSWTYLGNGQYRIIANNHSIKNHDDLHIRIHKALPSVFNKYLKANVIDDKTIDVYTDEDDSSVINGIIVKYNNKETVSSYDDKKYDVHIDYIYPYIPDRNDLKDYIFKSYGSFDKSEYAVKSRSGDGIGLNDDTLYESQIPGWEIFHNSSKNISDMRKGADIYNKVAFLYKILVSEFGSNYVKFTETTRSLHDQNNLQLGGNTSNFLSWHNFGLAVKIIVTEDGITPINETSIKFWKLYEIAKSFTELAYNGKLGESCNVIWCGLLATGADMGVWEFLPIGINHKDAWKFRDASYAQMDEFKANAWVNIDRKSNLPEWQYSTITILDDNATSINTPFIYKSSDVIKNAIIINNERWVDPNKVHNYVIPSELVLKDIQEFFYMIINKQFANGTELFGKKSADEWKSKNPKSYEQLVVYYTLIGNIESATTLLIGDYINKFTKLFNIAKKSPIKFIKNYLTSFYNNIKIITKYGGDNAYIDIKTGKMVVMASDVSINLPNGNNNLFNQIQLDINQFSRGVYIDGIFNEGLSIISKTDIPVINGYILVNGEYELDMNNISSDGYIIHMMIADDLLNKFQVLKDRWANFNVKVMYDNYIDSPNYEEFNLIENEFGTIMSQDLLTFTQLGELIMRLDINGTTTSYVDGTDLGINGDTVYEKLVSNAIIGGVRRVNISNESLIEDTIVSDEQKSQIIKLMNNSGRAPNVNDLL